MGEALEMLLFAQEQTKHPCTASSYSFSHVLPLVDYFASSCGCERALHEGCSLADPGSC